MFRSSSRILNVQRTLAREVATAKDELIILRERFGGKVAFLTVWQENGSSPLTTVSGHVDESVFVHVGFRRRAFHRTLARVCRPTPVPADVSVFHSPPAPALASVFRVGRVVSVRHWGEDQQHPPPVALSQMRYPIPFRKADHHQMRFLRSRASRIAVMFTTGVSSPPE